MPPVSHAESDAAAPPLAPASFGEAVRTWAYIGLNSFGGPAGQIAVMHRVLVEQKRWISEQRFLHALNYCMILPGPEATQLATYIGWLLHRTAGGLVAGTLFVAPGFITILALSYLYAGWHDVTLVAGMFFGLAAAVLAVVVEAVVRIGRRALRNGAMWGIAAGAFVAIFFFEIPFPFIIAGAALLGYLGLRLRPDLFTATFDDETADGGDATIDTMLGEEIPDHARPGFWRSLRTLGIWLTLWLGPILAMWLLLGWDDLFTRLSVFFSTVAVVSFGGAYAVLAYVAQHAVETQQWLTAEEMVRGLGMAETTPGPLIMVVQFVGFLAAQRDPGAMPPMLAGTLGAIVVTWVTFTPCFLWIFLGAPYVEHLRSRRGLSAALSGVTAAVVGVILNLALWFALHTLFGEVESWRRFGIRLLVPRWETLDPAALVIAAIAFLMLLRLRWGLMPTLALCAALGAALHLWVGQ